MGFFLRAFHGGTVAGHGELINMNIHADGQYARGWANCCMGCMDLGASKTSIHMHG